MAGQSAKQVLRKEIKRRLATLSEVEKERQSKIVTQKLLATDKYKESRRVSVFLSMPDEVRTDGILRHIFESQKQCYIPRYIGPNMDMVRLHSLEDYAALPETSWKIKQPNDDEEREEAMATGGLDLIIMPGLGFTKEGARLGRGRGYYDNYLLRYLKTFGRLPSTIAVTYKEQICESVPVTEHDVPIDMVLFET